MVGEEDVIAFPNYTNCYTTTVKCISQDAKLVYMMREDFMKLQAQQPKTWSFLIAQVQEKSKRFSLAVRKTNKEKEKIIDVMKSAYQTQSTNAKNQTT